MARLYCTIHYPEFLARLFVMSLSAAHGEHQNFYETQHNLWLLEYIMWKYTLMLHEEFKTTHDSNDNNSGIYLAGNLDNAFKNQIFIFVLTLKTIFAC